VGFLVHTQNANEIYTYTYKNKVIRSQIIQIKQEKRTYNYIIRSVT